MVRQVRDGSTARPLNSASQLEQHLHIDEMITATTSKIIEDDLPIDGPTFPNMQECTALGLPKFDADFSAHYQQCYHDENLSLDKLEQLQGETCRACQLLPDWNHASSHWRRTMTGYRVLLPKFYVR